MAELVIGLRGLSGAGKSTIAQEICNVLNSRHTQFPESPRATVLSFAGPIKAALRTLGITKEGTPELYRELAQTVGQRARDANPNHWVELFGRRLLETDQEVVVVDDVRYPNEDPCCHFSFMLDPHGFDVNDLGDRANHESETYNRERGGEFIEITNWIGAEESVAKGILAAVFNPAEATNDDRPFTLGGT